MFDPQALQRDAFAHPLATADRPPAFRDYGGPYNASVALSLNR